MSNSQEYISIYEQHHELIDKPCAALLNKARGTAFEKFKKAGFPDIKEED